MTAARAGNVARPSKRPRQGQENTVYRLAAAVQIVVYSTCLWTTRMVCEGASQSRSENSTLVQLHYKKFNYFTLRYNTGKRIKP